MDPFVAGPQIHQEKEKRRDTLVGHSGLNYAARYPIMPQYDWT